MGLFSWISGLCEPPRGLPPRSVDEVRAAILAVNRPSAPFMVREGGRDEAELVSEWRIADAHWHEIFAKAGLKKTAKVLMRLYPDAREVRSVDQEWAVARQGGAPKFGVGAPGSRGQQAAVEYGTACGLTEQAVLGQIYQYRFSSAEMTNPLRRAVLGCGWRWRGVAFGRL